MGADARPQRDTRLLDLLVERVRKRLVGSGRLPDPGQLRVAAEAAVVMDQNRGLVLYAKEHRTPRPIASITKLISAMVVLDARLPPDQTITISQDDVDRLRHSRSKLPVGTTLSRRELLRLMLLASENRAAAALARSHPGGTPAFVAAMNRKARQVGMQRTQLFEPTGLDECNQASAEDLAWLLRAAFVYPEIRRITTLPAIEVRGAGAGGPIRFRNTNRLVRGAERRIGLSKTGYINEAGRCLVMQARAGGRSVLLALLGAGGGDGAVRDATRILDWLASAE